MTRSNLETASLNSNGIGGIFFVRGMVQPNTVTIRTAAELGRVVSPVVHSANVGLVSALCAPVERIQWFTIREALAFRASDEQRGAFPVRRKARVVAEREFIAVTSQMALADMMERSDNAAFQQSEETFYGVRVDDATGIHACLRKPIDNG